MKPTEQHFPVVLFSMLYKVVLTFESPDEIFKCNDSNELTDRVLPCGNAYTFSIQSGTTKAWKI